MSITIAQAATFNPSTGSSTYSFPVTVTIGDNRRLVFAYTRENVTAIGTPTFNGQTVDQVHNDPTVITVWDYQVPSGLAPGNYTFSITNAGSIAQSHFFVWQLNNVLPGAPFSISTVGVSSGTTTQWSCAIDSPEAGAILAVAWGASSGLPITLDANSNVTSRLTNSDRGFFVNYGDGLSTTASSRTILSTTASSSTNRRSLAISYALAPAPNPVNYRRLSGITTFY